MTVRLKCVVSLVDKHTNNVYLHPVYSGSDENKEFFKYTPGGQITFNCLNESALAQFEQGKEYYVDFSKVE